VFGHFVFLIKASLLFYVKHDRAVALVSEDRRCQKALPMQQAACGVPTFVDTL